MSPMKKMPGKRVQFDEETWEAIEAVMRASGCSFQELTDEAFSRTCSKSIGSQSGLWHLSRRVWASVRSHEPTRRAAKKARPGPRRDTLGEPT